MALTSPRLGHDILLELLHHVPRQADVAALMRCCKALQVSGIKVLLSRGATVKSASQLHSLCAFVLRDLPARAHHLRRLYIKIRIEPDMDDDFEDGSDAGSSCSSSAPTKETLAMLLKVLQQATNLEDLSIDSCEELLEREKRLAKAIISLERLRRLQLHSVGELTGSILDGSKSSLMEIDLHCYCEEICEPDFLIPMVKRYADTLEKLSGWYVELGDATVQFPRVRALALRRSLGFDRAALQKAFPGLRYLEISDPAELELEYTRQESNAAAADGSPWGTLDRLCGSVDALYALGAAPRAKVVEVDEIGTEAATSLEGLRSVLSEARPSHAVLHVGYPYGLDLHPEKMSELLPSEDGSITHLLLDIRTSAVKGKADKLLSNLASLLRSHPVKFLLLRLHDTPEGEEEPKPAVKVKARKPDGATRHEMISSTFGRTRHEDIVRLFLEASSTLQHVALDVKGSEASYWTIKRKGAAGLSLEELSAAAGRALVRAEDMTSVDRTLGLQDIP